MWELDSNSQGFPRNPSNQTAPKVINSLMYAITSTKPNIAYVVGRLSRCTSNVSIQHWQMVQRVVKYLKGTMNYGLSYMEYLLVLESYSDAS